MKQKQSTTANRRRSAAATTRSKPGTSTITDGHVEGEPVSTAAVSPATPRSGVWLSSKAAALRVGCSRRTIIRWIDAGCLKASRGPSPKDLGHLKIRVGDLESLIASGAVN